MTVSPIAPGISFVIPMFNEAHTIGACLERIRAVMQADPDCVYEIIVVDNGSTDASVSCATACGVEPLINTRLGSPATSRNLGAAAARFSIVSFVDADCLISQGLSRRLTAHFSKTAVNAGAYGGPVLSPETGSWVERAWAPTQIAPRLNNQLLQNATLAGANIAMRRDDFLRIGGFNAELISAEDDELCRRLHAAGAPCVSDSAHALVHLGYPKTLAEVLRKQRWQGSTQLAAHGHCGDRLVIATQVWLAAVISAVVSGALVLTKLHTTLLGGTWATLPVLALAVAVVVILVLPAVLASRRHRSATRLKCRAYLAAFVVAFTALAGRALGLIDELRRPKC